jgi:hypothetical protein
MQSGMRSRPGVVGGGSVRCTPSYRWHNAANGAGTGWRRGTEVFVSCDCARIHPRSLARLVPQSMSSTSVQTSSVYEFIGWLSTTQYLPCITSRWRGATGGMAQTPLQRPVTGRWR